MGGVCCAEGGGQPVESVSTMEEGAAEAAAEKAPAPEEDAPEDTAPEEEEAQEELKACLLFELPDGEQKLVEAAYRPLGVGFTMTSPPAVRVIKPGSMGEEMMIMPQWILQEINGENVCDMSSDEALQILKQAFDPLPEKP